jgi:hypothetical protein
MGEANCACGADPSAEATNVKKSGFLYDLGRILWIKCRCRAFRICRFYRGYTTKMGFRPIALVLAGAAIVTLALAAPLRAQSEPDNWNEIKCERYSKAWAQALVRMGRDGLGPAFLERHAAFLASGCTARADVCARSDKEIVVANAMIIMAMNAGMASTFPPFYCRD